MKISTVFFGVFFGVIAAFLVIKAPGWISESAAASRRSRANSIVWGLTPQKLVSACGPPRKDDLRQLYGDMYDREMVYDLYDFTFLTVGEGFSPKAKDGWERWTARVISPSSGQPVENDAAALVMSCLNHAN